MRSLRPKHHRAKTGKAVRNQWVTTTELARLDALITDVESSGDLATRRRAIAVRRYIVGEPVRDIASSIGVARATVTTWLRWYDSGGAPALLSRRPQGSSPKITLRQRAELMTCLDAGPQASGIAAMQWTSVGIRELIARRFGVYLPEGHVPRLLDRLGRTRLMRWRGFDVGA